jgi:hypothetical protein
MLGYADGHAHTLAATLMFTLRFDMRAPSWAGPAADLYGAAIDMCAWAETRGAVLAVLSEHHGADDGHLPAPLMLASAIAARTRISYAGRRGDPLGTRPARRMGRPSRGRVWYAFGAADGGV